MRWFRDDEYGNPWWERVGENTMMVAVVFTGFAVGALIGIWFAIGINEFCR